MTLDWEQKRIISLSNNTNSKSKEKVGENKRGNKSILCICVVNSCKRVSEKLKSCFKIQSLDCKKWRRRRICSIHNWRKQCHR